MRYRIVLTRHGWSLGQTDTKNYSKYGDMNVPLDPDRLSESIACGNFLTGYIKDTFNFNADNSPIIWNSQFLRPQQTTAMLKKGGLNDVFNEQNSRYYIDPLLNEQSFGIMPFIGNIKNPIKRQLAKLLVSLGKDQYETDPFTNKTALGQSPSETYHNVRTFINTTLAKDMKQGTQDMLIVSHGAVMKAFAMHWFHLYDRDIWKKLETPHNNDVWVIEGENENWEIKKIYDGETQTSLLDNPQDPLNGMKPQTWQDLDAPII